MAEKQEKETSLARWDPFKDLDLMTRGPLSELGWPRWSKLFGEFLGERARPLRGAIPPLDVTESDEAYRVTIELPGVKREDVTLDLQDRNLCIRGEKRSEREEKKDRSHWIERSYGSFSRSFTLPADAVDDRIEANFKDGILTVTIPKSEKAKPRTVAIKG
jgi:HSP20 family protein